MDQLDVLIGHAIIALAWIMRFERRLSLLEDKLDDLTHITRRDEVVDH